MVPGFRVHSPCGCDGRRCMVKTFVWGGALAAFSLIACTTPRSVPVGPLGSGSGGANGGGGAGAGGTMGAGGTTGTGGAGGGGGGPATIAFDFPSHDFGALAVGQSAADATFVVTNG